jgi:hypothetical protein
MIGQNLSSPYQWGTVISGGAQGAGSVLAPLPTAIAQCATGDCKANLAMAMIPGLSGMGNVGQFISGQVVKRVVQTPQGPLVFSATVEVVGDTVKLKAASLAHAAGVGVVTNPGPGVIKASFDGLKAELAAAGFSKAQVTALRISGPNSLRLINKTFNLK